MLLDPSKLNEASPAEVLSAAARGHLGLDHRFLRAFTSRKEEALPAVLEFAGGNRTADPVDLTPELIALFRHWKTQESLPFLLALIKEDPAEIPDEAIETLVEMGAPVLEPLLALYGQLEESESSEIAFILANLGVKDDRILELLIDRLDFDLADAALLLSVYGDRKAQPALEVAASNLDAKEAQLKREVNEAIEALDNANKPGSKAEALEPFDIWSVYPEEDDLPVDLLDEGERFELLRTADSDEIRAAAAGSFFNLELTTEGRITLLNAAKNDPSPMVRAQCWEALMNSTEELDVITAMLTALRDPELPVEERGGLMVGLAPEADRNEIRDAIVALYESQTGRAKALEAMWRSMHPTFRDNFAKHLEDTDLEVRRGAIWGVGYYGLKSELDKIRKLFDHEQLRSDALFAYALAIPTEVSRGRMNSVLSKIEKEARGLSELEEDLVKAALDERLMLAGKEPFFAAQQD